MLNFRSLLSGKMKVSKVLSLWIVLVGNCRHINARSSRWIPTKDLELISVTSVEFSCGCRHESKIKVKASCEKGKQSQYVDCDVDCDVEPQPSECLEEKPYQEFACEDLPAEHGIYEPEDAQLVLDCIRAIQERSEHTRGETGKKRRCLNDANVEWANIVRKSGELGVANRKYYRESNNRRNVFSLFRSQMFGAQRHFQRVNTILQYVIFAGPEFVAYLITWCTTQEDTFKHPSRGINSVKVNAITVAIATYRNDAKAATSAFKTSVLAAIGQAKRAVIQNSHDVYQLVKRTCDTKVSVAEDKLLVAKEFDELNRNDKQDRLDKDAIDNKKNIDKHTETFIDSLCALYETLLHNESKADATYLTLAQAQALDPISERWDAERLKEVCGDDQESVEDVQESVED